MSTLTISRTHALPIDLLVRRLIRLAARFENDAETSWRSRYELVFNTTGTEGTVTCKRNTVEACVKTPWFAKAKVQRFVEKLLDELISTHDDESCAT